MPDRAYAILPYKELTSLIEQSSTEFDLNLKIREGNVEAALPAAIEAEKNGAEIIISRGGTAEIIRKYTKIPVVDIPVSDIDILRILYPLRDQNKSILIVGFRNAVYRCHSIAQVLGLNVKELTIPYETREYNFDYIKCQAEKLIKQYEVDTIIGDQTAYVNLQSFCESLYLIKSSKDDVIEAIGKTKNVLSSYNRMLQANVNPVRSVLDFIDDAVISTDDKGIITIFNRSAEQLFSKSQELTIGKRIEELPIEEKHFSSLKKTIIKVLKTNVPEYQELETGTSERCMLNTTPIIIDNRIKGSVSTIKNVSEWKQISCQKHRTCVNGFSSRYNFNDIVTKDPDFRQIIETAKSFSKTNATILIEGESGVGKELFAQSIHSTSSRSEKPFVAVNCAALPSQLLESELFGYSEGSFTGAQKGGKKGLFELADNGTIFLDEISEIDQNLQVKFLRVLEEKQIMRIGGSRVININVQVITATNKPLKQLVLSGDFRSDLYYRINLLKIQIPPLRERKDDIEYLASHFIRVFNIDHSLQIESLSEDVLRLMRNYYWPGNVRELKNIIERIALTIRQGNIKISDIKNIASELSEKSDKNKDGIDKNLYDGTLAEIKYRAAYKALHDSNFNKSLAARKLDIDRSTLERLLEHLN